MGEEFSKHSEISSGSPETDKETMNPVQLLARMKEGNYRVPLSPEEEKTVFTYYRSLPEDSRHEVENALLEQYVRWVNVIAARLIKGGFLFIRDTREVLEPGTRGLRRAIRRFDPAQNARFTSYSFRAIRNEILREKVESEGSMHIPAYVYEDLRKFESKERGGTLTAEERVEMEDLRQKMERKDRYYDVDMLENEGDDDDEITNDPLKSPPSYERFRNEEAQSVDLFEIIAAQEERELLAKWMDDILTDREKGVLQERLNEKILEEIAAALGISRERARQIETMAIAKLRRQRRQDLQ